MDSHGVSIDVYHAALLTVLVALWAAWFIAGALAQRHGAGLAVVAGAVALVGVQLALGRGYEALYLLQWVGFALLGANAERWLAAAVSRAHSR